MKFKIPGLPTGISSTLLAVTQGLRRYYDGQQLHFITTSCYHRRPLLDTASRRDLFLRIFEEVRARYRFVVVGYVVMPEHVHLLISEPEKGDPSKVIQVLKQRLAWRLLPSDPPAATDHFWQRRSYDFNVISQRKLVEKLRYMHRNPVVRGLVNAPELWPWSSYRAYAFREAGPVKINNWPTELRRIAPDSGSSHPDSDNSDDQQRWATGDTPSSDSASHSFGLWFEHCGFYERHILAPDVRITA